MHLDGAVSLLVSIYGCTPKRVKFCLFDDASHHAEHMILNIEEFSEYKPDLRPLCNTPETKTPVAVDGNQRSLDAVVAECRGRAAQAPRPAEAVTAVL